MDKNLCDQSAQQRNQEDETVEFSYTNACTELQDMSEDCLRDILSIKTLQLMDLCSVAETCKRLRFITQGVVGRNVWLTVGPGHNFFSDRFNYNATPSDSDRLLRNFAPCVGWIHIDNQSGLSLVREHRYEKLKSLKIYHCQISATLAEELKPVFRRLNSFTLFESSIEGTKTVFDQLNSLDILNLIDLQNYRIILDNVFPKLTQFRYKNDLQSYDDGLHLETITAFITRHPTLKSVWLKLNCGQIWWTNIMEAIGSSCTDLESLTCISVEPITKLPTISLQPLQALKSLNFLCLNFIAIEDFEALSHLTKLNTVNLDHCLLPEDVTQFACLSQITYLHLMHCKSPVPYHITDIIKPLVNLMKLNVCHLRLFET